VLYQLYLQVKMEIKLLNRTSFPSLISKGAKKMMHGKKKMAMKKKGKKMAMKKKKAKKGGKRYA
jgi:hypothetical protein